MTAAAYSTSADCEADGWNFVGPTGPNSDVYAEKRVQCGGKMMAAANAVSACVAACQAIECQQQWFGNNSPEVSTFDGSI